MINKLVEDFLLKNKEYKNDVNNFISYMDYTYGKDAIYSVNAISGMTSDIIIDSLVYLTEKICTIKKKAPAYKYICAIGELFYYIYSNSGYPSKFYDEIDSKRRISYYFKVTEFINNSKYLKGSDVYTALDDNSTKQLIEWCDDKINVMINQTSTNDRIDFKRMSASLCFKTMLYTGITYRVAKDLDFRAIHEYGNININGYIIPLPENLSKQYSLYKEICSKRNFNTFDGKLFVDENGKGLKNKTYNGAQFLKTAIDKRNLTGVYKTGIINMITAGIDSEIVRKYTDAGDDVINDCIRYMRSQSDWNVYLSKTVKNSPIYDHL